MCSTLSNDRREKWSLFIKERTTDPLMASVPKITKDLVPLIYALKLIYLICLLTRNSKNSIYRILQIISMAVLPI